MEVLMRRSAITVGILMLIAMLAGSVSAASYSQNLAANDTLKITCSGVLQVVMGSGNQSADVTCVPVVQPTNTPIVPTNTPVTPTVTPVPVNSGLLLSRAEIQALPMTGKAWDNLKAKALGSWGSPNLQDLNSQHDVYTLAGALYYARTGDATIRAKTANAIMSSIGTENGGDGRTLAPSRNLVSYVIAADIINLHEYDATKDAQWRTFISAIRNHVFDGRTIITTHNERPNNWGTHAGATRVAIDRYIGDTADLQKAAMVFKGWLGDRTSYAGFKYGELDWQFDASKPVGINPKGAIKDGHNIDGVLPDDQRRGCTFTWPPCKENYVWEALQGASVQALLLQRAGYPVFDWQDKALYRAVAWEYNINGFAPSGDDVFIPWIINKKYGTSFAVVSPVATGKNFSYTDWLYQ